MSTWGLPTVNDDRQRRGKGRIMPENTSTVDENATQGATAEPDRTFTQAEMDAIIGDRLKRERAKYADYEDVKAKAAKYDELEAANKSELEKAVEERDRLASQVKAFEEEKAHAEAVAKAAAEHGVDASLLARMQGDVDENAKFLKEQMASAPKYGAVNDGGEAANSAADDGDWLRNALTHR